MKRIALLGAPGSGKTRLGEDLAAHLRSRGLRVAVVPLAAAADVVVADSTALMIAVHAGHGEANDLVRFALGRQPQYDATLLMGLDIPSATGGREAVDATLRSLLQRAQVPFQVVYGEGPQRLQGALAALETAGVLPAGTAHRASAAETRRWVWACEKCSDPACEHRLFAQLRDARG